jgi:hypothetical protein
MKRESKEIIIANMADRSKLADEIGLNLKKLKWVSNKFMAILFTDSF